MNRRLHILLIFSMLAVVPFLSTSCSSKKSLTKTTLREFTAAKLIKEVEENQFEFDNFVAKMNMKIETKDRNINVKGQLRMKKDSIIWTSVSMPMGLEVLRIKVTTDSVYFLNRTEKTYLAENIEVFNDISPMITTIGFIQAVFVGNDINLRESDDYNIQIADGQYNLSISKKLKKTIKNNDEDWKVMLKDLWIDPQLFKITRYHIREYNDSKRKIDLQYSDFEEVNGKYFPKEISVDIHGDLYLKAHIEFSNITVNEPLEFNFSIPKKYERIYK
ncbi:MAG: DUF4292 domain-containing protein [Bacteroidales bacterium]|nr:DUF4292 domain-containing protein [Bacteroidales bacterium]